MASIRKNFIFNALLTICGYIFPLMVIPYVSRILGVANMGACNFVDSIVDYFTIFSMMGINTLGIREIAKSKNCREDLNKVFSELFSLNTITTLIAVLLLTIAVFCVPKFQDYRDLFYLGILKLFFNYMLINWFFQGLEDFKYITMRYVVVKTIFVIAIFTLIHTNNDTILYYTLVCLSWALNGIINIIYSKKIVSFRFTINIRKEFITSFFILGCYWFMNSLYTTFNVVFLGFRTNDTEVGYYTSANRLLCIIIALFTTLSSVIVPRVSSLIKKTDSEEYKKIINKSFDAVIMFSIPLTIFIFYYSPNIIKFIFGLDFEGAITPLRIMSLLFLFMGINQILVLQILMPISKDYDILRNSAIAGISGIIASIVLVTLYGKNGASFELVLGEIVLLLGSLQSIRKFSDIRLPICNIIKHIIFIAPVLFIYFIMDEYIRNDIVEIFTSALCTVTYVTIIEYFGFKNQIIVSTLNKIKSI